MNGSRQLVLVVDDDPSILSAVRRILHRSPVEVVTATGPVKALEVLNDRDVGVVITDYMMPGMNGIELLILVRQKWPQTATIMMTALSDMRIAADAVNRHLVDYFVTKPWKISQFVGLVESALDQHREAERSAPQTDTRDGEDENVFGKYQLIEQIASGGMADLYRARVFGADGFEKDVAVKKIREHLSHDEAFVRMFVDEARIMTSLDHGNVVSVLDFGKAGDLHYLVMEYVDGIDLHRLLKMPGNQANPLPQELACFVAGQVCQGLAYAHRKTNSQGQPLGLVHRDIGPHNVLISKEGMVKITDFGIARAAGRQAVTQTGMVKGTLHYMSPEQITAEELDHRTDLYALGVVLYEMLTGRPPYTGATDQETIARIHRGTYLKAHVVNPKVDRRLTSLVHKTLRRKPRDRYQSAEGFEAAISSFLHEAGLHPTAAQLAALVDERITEDRLSEITKRRLT